MKTVRQELSRKIHEREEKMELLGFKHNERGKKKDEKKALIRTST